MLRMSQLERIIEWISGTLHTLGSIVLGFTFLYITADVILRFLKLRPIGDVVEATGYLNVWICFLGAGFLVREGHHIRVDLVTSHLSPGKKRFTKVITDLATAAFYLIMFYKGIDLVVFTHRLGIHTPSWGFPIWPLQIVVPVGFLCLLLETISDLTITILRKGAQDGT